MNKELIKRMKKWCKDLEGVTGLCSEPDTDTFDGEAYAIFQEILSQKTEIGYSNLNIVLNEVGSKRIEKALEQLSPRHQKVIELRFGLCNTLIHTFREIGQEFGVTPDRARQMEIKAIELMKKTIKKLKK